MWDVLYKSASTKHNGYVPCKGKKQLQSHHHSFIFFPYIRSGIDRYLIKSSLTRFILYIAAHITTPLVRSLVPSEHRLRAQWHWDQWLTLGSAQLLSGYLFPQSILRVPSGMGQGTSLSHKQGPQSWYRHAYQDKICLKTILSKLATWCMRSAKIYRTTMVVLSGHGTYVHHIANSAIPSMQKGFRVSQIDGLCLNFEVAHKSDRVSSRWLAV